MMMTTALICSTVLSAIGLGGGIYECLLVDRAWPRMPALIQPQAGGIDRKLFWGGVHSLYELSLFVALWASWNEPSVRIHLIQAFVLHFAIRVWSFAYFIPAAVGFERAASYTPAMVTHATRWVRLSRCRLVIEAGAAIALIMALNAAVRP